MIWYSHFLKNFPQLIVIYTVKGSGILIIREMHIKTTMRYHLTPLRWLPSKSLQTINVGKGVEKREPSYTVGGNTN